MCESDGLCLLHMRKAGHKRLEIIFYDAAKSLKKIFEFFIKGVNIVTGVELNIKSNLIVTAASGMKLFAGVSDPVSKLLFNKTVDVLHRLVNCDLTGFNIT